MTHGGEDKGVGSIQWDAVGPHTHAATISPNPDHHVYREPGGRGFWGAGDQGLTDAQTQSTALTVTVQNSTAKKHGRLPR